jgi:gamma-glutamyltranspeptidase / glutathione hydrolase
MSPLVVLKEGEPVYVLGAAGAARIISAIVQVLSRSLDEGLDFEQAMQAPRFHPVSRSHVRLESRPGARWPDDVAAWLEELGFRVSTESDPSYFGRIHGIHFDRQHREYVGVADPRRDGTAVAPDKKSQ